MVTPFTFAAALKEYSKTETEAKIGWLVNLFQKNQSTACKFLQRFLVVH